MPPILILLGFLAQRVFDSWREYMGSTVSGMITLTAGGAITAVIAVGIFLPSLFMMVMFHVLIVPSSDGGIYLPEGALRLVPRYSPGLPRTEGLQIHVLDDAYWPPLVMPEAKDLFAAAERVSEITRKDEKVFSTMASGRMLYFLADRDSIWDVANGYIFQIVTGVTTSDALIDFSDAELARAVEREMPGAIIMQSEHPETRRFRVNFPLTWSFIQGHYRLSEEIGPFQILVPNT
jgi:hypothetical protein